MAGFEIIMPKDIENLPEKLDLANKKAPGKIIEKMDKLGRKVIKAAREGTPEGPTKKSTKRERLKYNYRADPTDKVQDVWEKKIRNKAKHIHLVKYGHRVVRGGKVVGIARGVDYFEKAVKGIEGDIDAEYSKMIDDIMGDIFD